MTDYGGSQNQTAAGAAVSAYYTVATIAERDALPVSAISSVSGQQVGALVHVRANGMTYRLVSEGPVVWEPYLYDVADPATRELYVQASGDGTGDDENDGLTSGTPLASIRTAIQKFYALHKGNPHWDQGDTRTIHVLGSDGAEHVESIFVPERSGDGFLVIHFEEELEHTLVMDATPFTPIAGKEQRQTANFTTAPMTPNAFDDAAFLAATDRSGTYDFLSATWEDLPIVVNAAGSADVTVSDPGFYTAQGFGAGETVEVRRPRVTWRMDEDTELFAYAQAEHCRVAAPTMIRGAILKSNNSNLFASGIFGRAYSLDYDASYGSKAIVNRCIFDGQAGVDRYQTAFSGGWSVSGVIAIDPGFTFARDGMLTAVNVRHKSINGSQTMVLDNISKFAAYGIDTLGGLYADRVFESGILLIDVEKGAHATAITAKASCFRFTALSIGPGFTTAIYAYTYGTVRAFVATEDAENAGRLSGSVVRGIEIGPGGFVQTRTTNPLVCSGNEIQFAAGGFTTVPRTFAGGSHSEPDIFARIYMLL